LAGLAVAAFCVAPPTDPAAARLRQVVAALWPLCKPMPKAGPADWLANHPEPGQTFECGMNGTNNLDEEDAQPLHFCAQCTAKVCWASGAEPGAWMNAVREFLETAGLKEDAEFYRKAGQLPLFREGRKPS
jgi:hypothetical protein